MPPIRRRDARAIAFCLITITAMFVGMLLTAGSWLLASAATVAYAIWLSLQPRIQRLLRRLRGDTTWDLSGYYED